MSSTLIMTCDLCHEVQGKAVSRYAVRTLDKGMARKGYIDICETCFTMRIQPTADEARREYFRSYHQFRQATDPEYVSRKRQAALDRERRLRESRASGG